MSGQESEVRPRIGITVGDPRGIGPEITIKALGEPRVARAAEFLLIGPGGIDTGSYRKEEIGQWSDDGPAEAGRLAGLAIARGVELALSGDIDALVTAPIDKAAFQAGGWHYPGHTEMLQSLTKAKDVVMMMSADHTVAGGSLRVVLATTHMPLRAIADALTTGLFVRQATLTAAALRKWWGMENPRLAMCAVNPHASDGGLFGDEEERVLRPAIERLRADGISTSDPIPADTVFKRAISGEFDVVIAPYHDVGMAPFKTVSFGSGVNVTLGLPFPRTSPDHGTALDIAGRNSADPSSMVEAIQLAIRLARRF